jgi:peptide-methionine (R)-S-oxide reductase
MADKIQKTDAEWREQLSPDEYRVARERGTEPAFTGRYWDHHADGTYTCIGCGEPLFDAETKFESGSGWPSYFAPVDPGAVEAEEDSTHGMRRTEVHCARCGTHLGHIFPDGPKPTGLRYCVNSLSLGFKPK